MRNEEEDGGGGWVADGGGRWELANGYHQKYVTK